MAQAMLLKSPGTPDQLLIRLRDVSAATISVWSLVENTQVLTVLFTNGKERQVKVHPDDSDKIMGELNKAILGLRAE